MTEDNDSAIPFEHSQRGWLAWTALAGILIVAALLRFHGLAWGLRHVPDHDEIVFVESARAMIRAGDLDHRFYEYPGLFIYMLAPVVAFFPAGKAVDPAAFLAVRSLVTVFSVVSVALVFFLARRLAGVGAGILAAALMAVAPIEVWTTHMLRSDVVLEAFALASLLWFHRMGGRLRDDVWSGVAVGLTAAVKFTGVLIAPAYVAARCARSGVRWPRMLLAGGVSALVWFAVTPYALIKPSAYRAGVWTQTDYFYGGASVAPHFLAYVGFYVRAILKGVGAPPDTIGGPSMLVPVAVCALLGLISLRRAWRAWLPLIVYPAVLILVLSTAENRLSRLALSCVGPFVVMAGAGLAATLRRSRALGGTLTAVVLALPLWHSLDVGRWYAAPSSMDRTLDWLEAHAPRGARILSAAPALGIDAKRYEVIHTQSLAPAECPWALGMDFVVVLGHTPAQLCPGLRSVALLAGPESEQQAWLQIFRPEAAVWTSITIRPNWLRASVSSERLPALVDDDLHSAWQTAGPQLAGTWIELSFPSPRTFDRIETVLGSRDEFARALDVRVRETGGTWQSPAVFAGRPHTRDLVNTGAPPSQVYLLHATRVSGLRLELRRGALQPWSVAELRIAVRKPAGGAASADTVR
jgi:4-amino-4-deoxy-L-arabinose transferase-like glycosyltransferase